MISDILACSSLGLESEQPTSVGDRSMTPKSHKGTSPAVSVAVQESDPFCRVHQQHVAVLIAKGPESSAPWAFARSNAMRMDMIFYRYEHETPRVGIAPDSFASIIQLLDFSMERSGLCWQKLTAPALCTPRVTGFTGFPRIRSQARFHLPPGDASQVRFI